MTIREAIEKMERKHVALPEGRTCDGVIYGDIDRECTGIAITCNPSVPVIREAAAQGCNLIIGHEPTFYGGYDETDWLKDDAVFQAKIRLLDDTGIVIYRNHDRVHTQSPDMVYSGVVRKLGWESFAAPENGGRYLPSSLYVIPETTVGELGKHVKDRLRIDGFRFMGDPEAKVTRIGLYAHFFGNDADAIRDIQKNGYEVIIPLETVDWTIWAYVEDAIALGRNLSLFNVGHFNLEEAGMELYQDFLREALQDDSMKIRFIQSGNRFKWFE